jgi:hypothetical protein
MRCEKLSWRENESLHSRKVADLREGSFALNGNHEMYADGNGYWRMVLPRMELEKRDSEWERPFWEGTGEALGRSSATRRLARN